MNKIIGLENWNSSAVPLAEQVAKATVWVVYPKVSDALLALAPKERRAFTTRAMQDEIASVIATNKVSNWKLLKAGKSRSRYHGVSGEIRVGDIPHIAALSAVQSVQIEGANGKKKRTTKARKKQGYYCVKMTVAIQV